MSVGLTSDKPDNKRNQQLHKVYESSGKVARLKRNATVDKSKHYQKKKANFNVDVDTEKLAYEICLRKKEKK